MCGSTLNGLVTNSRSGTNLQQFGYTYNANDHVVSETGPQGTTAYQYGQADRLSLTAGPAGSLQFGYDGAGNRTSMTDAVGTTSYVYDAAPSGNSAFTCDKAGNLLSDGKNQYGYDGLNRLTQVQTPSDIVSCRYDGDSLLAERATLTDADRFYWNDQKVINEGDGTGSITATQFGAGSQY
ncbi:MAG: repeat protein [Symbiobacteriaceae bacterium]|jgi:YD repeat-containing protein|nr:repeat protein [Symbiobacteriaceae bacterium]